MGTRLVDVGKFSSLQEKRGTRAVVEGQSYVLWKSGPAVIAAVNSCPHQHLETLHLGPVDEGVVTCPMHGWSFDLQTGKAVGGSGRLTFLRAEVQGDRVFIELHDES